jgi:hypothetical protein
MTEYIFTLWRGEQIVKIFFDIEIALVTAQTELLKVCRHRRCDDGTVTTLCIFDPGAKI